MFSSPQRPHTALTPTLSSILIPLTILLLAILPLTSADGDLQCTSGGYCVGQHGIISRFMTSLPYINDNDIWAMGVHIMCAPIGGWFVPSGAGFCLFMQADVDNGGGINEFSPPPNMNSTPIIQGISGAMVKSLLPQLYAAGCKGCGSIPLANNNNEDEGWMKLDGVSNVGHCDWICPPTSAANDPLNPLAQVAAAQAPVVTNVQPTAPVEVLEANQVAPTAAPVVVTSAGPKNCYNPRGWGCESAPKGKRRRTWDGEDVEGGM